MGVGVGVGVWVWVYVGVSFSGLGEGSSFQGGFRLPAGQRPGVPEPEEPVFQEPCPGHSKSALQHGSDSELNLWGMLQSHQV
jgi:hypothetical protein